MKATVEHTVEAKAGTDVAEFVHRKFPYFHAAVMRPTGVHGESYTIYKDRGYFDSQLSIDRVDEIVVDQFMLGSEPTTVIFLKCEGRRICLSLSGLDLDTLANAVDAARMATLVDQELS